MGVIAQDIEKVLPYVVETSENGIKSVNYINLIGLLIEGVKDLEKENKVLKEDLVNANEEIIVLKNKVDSIMKHLNI